MNENTYHKTFGSFLNFRSLQHAPVNEQGVVFLFGMIAFELGFVVESIGTRFPDCEAKRLVNENKDKWDRVRIEFEYCSRNFITHGHEIDGCDLIVCWLHNWEYCPIEVIELKSIIKSLDSEKSKDDLPIKHIRCDDCGYVFPSGGDHHRCDMCYGSHFVEVKDPEVKIYDYIPKENESIPITARHLKCRKCGHLFPSTSDSPRCSMCNGSQFVEVESPEKIPKVIGNRNVRVGRQLECVECGHSFYTKIDKPVCWKCGKNVFVEGVRRYLKCINCGHKFYSTAKSKPRCSRCNGSQFVDVKPPDTISKEEDEKQERTPMDENYNNPKTINYY